jgi:hypothetical protein
VSKGASKEGVVKAVSKSRARRLRPDAQVRITISAETLLGLDDNPAFLDGFGPVIASMGRDVAATGTWRCAIVDGQHGTLNGLGTSTFTPGYAPSVRLRRHLSARDQTCRYPGCNRAARKCDFDHSTRYPEGVTCECNGQMLCGHHHRLKHETGFDIRLSTDPQDPPGTVIVTTPAGRVIRTTPDPLDPNIAAFNDPAPGNRSATDGSAAPETGTETGTGAEAEAGNGGKESAQEPPPDNGPPPY